MEDLFSFADNHAISRNTSPAVTSDVPENAECLRFSILRELRARGPMRADTCAAVLGVSLLSVRPRFSELRTAKLIEKTGERAKNTSGRTATIWRVPSIAA